MVMEDSNKCLHHHLDIIKVHPKLLLILAVAMVAAMVVAMVALVVAVEEVGEVNLVASNQIIFNYLFFKKWWWWRIWWMSWLPRRKTWMQKMLRVN